MESTLNALIEASAMKKARKADALESLRSGVMPPMDDLRLLDPGDAYLAACAGGNVDLETIRLGPIGAVAGISKAAENGKADAVRLIIERYPFVLEECSDGDATEIATAIYTLKVVTGESFPDLEPWIEKGRVHYEGILIEACERGELASVIRLVNAAGSRLKQWGFDIGYERAAERGHIDVMKYIESHHSPDSDAAWIGACRGRQLAIVKSLTGRPIKNPKEVFKAACAGGDMEIIAHSIEVQPTVLGKAQVLGSAFNMWQQSDVSRREEILRIASSAGHIDVVRAVEPISNAAECIEAACLKKRYDVILYLLRCQYSSLDTALAYAAEHKDPSLVSVLLDYTDPRPNPDAAMYAACHSRRLRVLSSLIARGAKDWAKGIEGLNARLDLDIYLNFSDPDELNSAFEAKLRLSADCIGMAEDKREEMVEVFTTRRASLMERVVFNQTRLANDSISTIDGTWNLFFTYGYAIHWLRGLVDHLDCCIELLKHC